MALTSPPPWSSIGHLVHLGVYIYFALLILAIINATVRRFSPRLPNFSYSLLQHVPFPGRIFLIYRELLISYTFQISLVRLSCSAFVCVAYVYVTYVAIISKYFLIALRTIGIILFTHAVSVVATCDRPLAVVCNIVSIAEVISLSSLLFAQPNDWLNFSFLQAYGIMSSYITLEPAVDVRFNFKSSQFQRQLARRALEFIVFIYVFACGLQLFEHMGEPWPSLTATKFELTLVNSFYFTVVTLFTVGYGDFVPFTLLGRLWIIFIIVFGAYLISRKIGQVVDVVSDLRRGRGSFVKAEGTEHCVICGNVKWEYLKSFVQEFYEDERNSEKKLVVICDRPNWTEDTWSRFSATHHRFRQHVVYLEGACVSREDLVRAQVETALAVFVLCNQHNPDPYAEDSETLKRILTIRSYTPNRPIYSMCALRDSMLQITFALEHMDENEAREEGISRRDSMDLLTQRRGNTFDVEDLNNNPTMRDYSEDDDDDDGLLVHSYDGSSDLKSEAICMQDVEMSLMAENVFCNGLSTLLANLILRIDPINKATDQPWAIEYKIGSECRFEFVKLPISLHQRKFSEIAVIMYDYGVLLIATKRFMEQKWRAITPDTIIKINTVGLIITYHAAHYLDVIMTHVADRVSRLFEESGTDLSSRDVPSVDDDFPEEVDIPRHSIAGGRLAGDLSMTNEFDDSHPLESPLDGPSSFSGHPWNSRSVHTPHALANDILPPSQSAGMLEPLMTDVNFGDEEDRFSKKGGPSESSRSLTLPPRSKTAPVLAPTSSADAVDVPVSVGDFTGTGLPVRETIVDDEEDTDSRRGSLSPLSRAVEARPVVSDSSTGESDVVKPKLINSPSAALSADRRVPPARRKSHTHHVTFPMQPVSGRNSVSKRQSGMNNEGSSWSRRQMDANGDCAAMYYGDEELPMQIKGHIVVCAIGEMSVMNLKYFLQRVWMKRGIADEDTPVVAICPSISEDAEAELSTFVQKNLFLIQGNSLSVETLRSAQYDEARAIVILACEDKTHVEEMDAKAMFTVMTLDYLLGEQSQTFVCTMLDAEESMQLLRAPMHARRRGASLGSVFASSVRFDLRREVRSVGLNESAIRSQRRNPGRSSDNPGTSFGALSVGSVLPQTMSFVGQVRSTYTNRRESIANLVTRQATEDNGHMRTSTTFLSRRSMGFEDESYFPPGRGRSFGHGSGHISHFPSMTLGFEASSLSISGANGIGRAGGASGDEDGVGSGRLGGTEAEKQTYSRPRDESFEKQRYASGEMMISSTFMTLLIREYAMPGLTAIVRKIFGAGFGQNVKSKPSWIRTVNVPVEWIGSGDGGKRTYREVFEMLVSFGGIAIGLYRAGDVMVRIQVQEDEGRADTSEEQGTGDGMDSDTDIGALSGAVHGLREVTGVLRGFEMGGDGGHREMGRGVYDQSNLADNVARMNYGSMRNNTDSLEGDEGDEGDESRQETRVPRRGEDTARLNISPELLMNIAVDMRQARQTGDDGIDQFSAGGDDSGGTGTEDQEDDADDLNEPGVHRYTCPNTGREAYFHEVHGGDNVLPYVYANPEPYTIVSPHDAVYVVVAPHVTLPEKW